MKAIIKLLCVILIVSHLFDGGVMATGIIARLSDQAIYIDGQRADIIAYNIDGSNYVRLRELGKAADFSVCYDPFTDTVRITRLYSYAGGFNEVLPSPGDNVSATLSHQQIYVNGIPVIITRNTKDYKEKDVIIKTAEEYLAE